MILEYHRPETIQAALKLLDRKSPSTKPIGGGTVLNQPSDESIAVVDLQALGLDGYEPKGTFFNLGACLTLESLRNIPELQPVLQDAIQLESTHNLRQVATLAGNLVAGNGRSTLATAMLALDAHVQILRHLQKPIQLSLGDLLPMRAEKLKGALISQILLPMQPRLAFLSVARTPADLPIVCVAVAVWPSGRTRVALGGWGDSPLLAMDGPEPAGAQLAAANATSQADDAWASAEYRQHVAGILTRRCLDALQLAQRDQ